VRRILLAFVIALSVACASLPVRHPLVIARPHVEGLRTAKGNIFCTVFPINKTEHLWMTALHCAVGLAEGSSTPQGDPYPAFINGEATVPYKFFPESGVAILFTPGQTALAFQLDDTEVYEGEKIEMAGHGLGLENTTWFHGDVAAVNVYSPWGMFFNFFSMPVCHGHSGSPVLNSANGKVMSVMQIVLSEGSCGSPSGGTTLPDLTRETGAYWQH
jgi:V8-like Glu-specific endopeptidase